MRVVLTSAYGVKADISDRIETLLIHGEYDDFLDVLTTRFIDDLGRKLVLVGGRLGPMATYFALEPHMTPGYAAHVASLWGLVDFDDTDIDQDDVPSIAISGPPPAGRLRATFG